MSRSLFASILALGAAGCSVLTPSGGGGGTDPIGDVTPTGCLSAAPQHVAPGGYYVNGNTVCTADGHAHLFHGIARPSMEWTATGEFMSAGDFALMGSGGWKANVVRVALNQDFWLAGSNNTFYDAGYPARVDQVIAWAKDAGMDVILDLHWSDAGMLGQCAPNLGCQQLMADANSLTFWSEVAARYKDDGRVLFELYNEPHDVSWPVWKSGGNTGMGWTAVGMQQMYDAVRAAGADNLVIAGGLNYAYDLSEVSRLRISGYNIMYATHPYGGPSEKAPGAWDSHWGYLAATDPVIVTEFGDLQKCDGAYSQTLITYADRLHASWTAWAWYPGGCSFPALIDDWDGTPSGAGMVVKTALGRY